MVTKVPVEMDLCVRIAGEIKCKSKGYKATYHKAPGTVGPVELVIEYPT